jgi:thioesterase domain-containing protein
MELYPLGRKMRWLGPVIGIQARGLDGRDPPHDTIEAMAEEYLAAVKARQPNGPYFLCGYSFGGLVAFELACRLQARGDVAAFVGVFATLPPGHRFLRARAWTAYFLRRLAKGVFAKNDRPFRAWAEQARARAVRLRAHQAAPPELRAVAERAMSASAAYRPGTYAGELTIFEPSSRDLRLPPSSVLWSRHVRALRLHSLPGRHGDMLFGANTAGAAELLTQCLEAAALAHPSASTAG